MVGSSSIQPKALKPLTTRLRAVEEMPLWFPLASLIVGLVAGPGVLAIGYGSTPQSRALFESQHFWLWALATGLQWSFALIMAGPSIYEARRIIRRRTASRMFEIYVALALAVVIIIIGEAVLIPASPLAFHTIKMGILALVGGILIGVPATTIIWDQHLTLRIVGPRRPSLSTLQYIELSRRKMANNASLLGILVALAALSMGARRLAQLDAYRESPSSFHRPEFTADAFPKESILTYGAFYSLLMATIYLLPHLELARKSRQLVNRLTPRPNTKSELGEWLKLRADLKKEFPTSSTLLATLRALIPIASPLVSGILGALLSST